MTDGLIKREEDRTIMAEYNGHMCAGKKGTEAAPQKREREMEEETQRWTDKDLKETGNGFTFTTHFALRLTFGGEQMWLRALGSHCSHASSRMNMEQAQLAALAGSFPTERQIFSQFFTSPPLWKMRGGGRQKWGLLRGRMRNATTVTRWQQEDKKTGIRVSPWFDRDGGNKAISCMEESTRYTAVYPECVQLFHGWMAVSGFTLSLTPEKFELGILFSHSLSHRPAGHVQGFYGR